jgi:hypothetical protein
MVSVVKYDLSVFVKTIYSVNYFKTHFSSGNIRLIHCTFVQNLDISPTL